MTKISENLDFDTLQTHAGLTRLDRDFLALVEHRDPELHGRLRAYRSGAELNRLDTSHLLLELAPILEWFIADRFEIQDALGRCNTRMTAEQPVADFKEEFIKRRAKRYRREITRPFSELDFWLESQIGAAAADDRELAIAHYAQKLLADTDGYRDQIDRLTEWCVLAQRDVEAHATVRDWPSFRLPNAVDATRLVPLEKEPAEHTTRLLVHADKHRQRDGFELTDRRMTRREISDQINYCVYCHERGDDFCAKGFPEKKKEPERGLKMNALGVTLTGCPLDEKISEMHLLKRDGLSIGALAVAMVDNPMIPATGHRICNDCMKACIYQKQDPVNIPQIETGVLTDVLELPWGVEIYDLLARWNPLRRTQYVMQPDNGKRVLIAGMGPAGFTMAHHLTMEGCTVVGIDGLKIEPLPAELLNRPVASYAAICEDLEDRIMTGFGGVAEYGITVRWDKNFLKLIYLTLARRKNFQVFGGVRFGGTITVANAWDLGFDHICVANGAGLPRVINMGNSLARGMRQANDFLMALQLTGAAKEDSLANLQIRLPALVIGGGLTAIDTATEVQAYYIKQVEKILHRYEALAKVHDAHTLTGRLDVENREILREFLEHGRAIREERRRAARLHQKPDFIRLIRAWGGVSIVYRRSINESPAYIRNHEEIIKAMEEGIYYLEGLDPVRADLDDHRHVKSLICRPLEKSDGRWVVKGKDVELPARAILVAAGTFPNTIYEQEHPGTFKIDDNHFLPHVAHTTSVQPVDVAEHCKAPEFGAFTSYFADGRNISFLGDAHPVFNGSVVKAIASAQRSYPDIVSALEHAPPAADDRAGFQARMEHALRTHIAEFRDISPTVMELRVHAPLAARNFQPGQFFRLQMYESLSPKIDGTRLQLPLQTVSGAGIDGDRIRLFLIRYGPNARLLGQLKAGDPVVLMGPTGAPTDFGRDKTVMVVAQSWGTALMLGLAPALRANGNRVVFLGCFDNRDQVYAREELERITDQIVWATDQGECVTPGRPQDISIQEPDVVSLIRRYCSGESLDAAGPKAMFSSEHIDAMLVVGATGLLRALQSAMKTDLANLFREDIEITGAVGSPMQCMLKGVCSQCLQWQIDPDTGERTRAVFSCAEQDQPLMWIDMDNLAARQGQNRLQEYLAGLWVDHILDRKADGRQKTA